MKLFVAIAFVALIGGSFVDARAVRDLKSDLITRGQALLTRADAAVRELEHVHNVHEAAIIRSEETRIRTLIAELELASPTASVAHLEAELTRVEEQLTRELERIHRVVVDPIHVPHEPVVHLPGKRDTKSDLIARGNALLARADAAIRTHEAARNTHEVAIIRSEEAKVRALIAELELATATTSLVHLEHQLSAAEQQLTYELEKINHRVVVDPIVHVPHTDPIIHHEPVVHHPGKRDTKSDLIARGNALLARATSAIVTHEARHNTHEVAIIRSEEAKIRSLITQLELATPTTSIIHLEHELSAAEQQLTYELEKINHLVVVDPIVHVPHTDPIIHHEPVVHHEPHHQPGKRDTKSDLIARGTALLARADVAIRTHEAARNTHEVAIIRSEEAKIRSLITELELATATTSLVHLEHQLSAAEQQLTYELEKINHRVVVDPIVHLPHEPVVHHEPIVHHGH